MVLPWLANTSSARFNLHFGASAGGVQEFWGAFSKRPACNEFRDVHPWLRGRSPADLKWHLPLIVFDDAGPFSATNITFARVWYSILGRGSEKESRFVISTGIKDNALEDWSWPVILDSFKRLAEPVEEGRWGGILLFFGADLEYVCNILGLPDYNARENMCTDCLANTTDRPRNAFQANAGWRATLVDNRQYIAEVRRPLRPLPAHAAFNRHTYRFDLLHMYDHHGVTSHVIGNVLWAHLAHECESNVLLGIRREDPLACLQEDIEAFYRHCNVDNRLPPLKESKIKADAFPELRGNGVKAANTRALLPYVCDLQKRATQQNPNPEEPTHAEGRRFVAHGLRHRVQRRPSPRGQCLPGLAADLVTIRGELPTVGRACARGRQNPVEDCAQVALCRWAFSRPSQTHQPKACPRVCL